MSNIWFLFLKAVLEQKARYTNNSNCENVYSENILKDFENLWSIITAFENFGKNICWRVKNALAFMNVN